jgi:hypothetical protein
MPLVRSITFFIPFRKKGGLISNLDDIEEYINRSLDRVESLDIEPWTIRFVLPPWEDEGQDKCFEMVTRLYDALPEKNLLLHPLAIRSSQRCLRDLVEILGATERIYSTILLDVEDIDVLIDEVYLKDVGPGIFTRVSLTHLDWVQTPYFPSTTNRENVYAYAVALRYVDIFDSYLGGDEEAMASYLREIQEELSRYPDEFLGLDLSLSPWMDESVGQLVEKHFDCKLGEPGSFHGVYKINNEISRIIEKYGVKAIGFNEIMLAVGEDNLLKERVEKGELNLSTLIGLVSVCVAGLDMVAIKRDKRLIKNTILDVDHISRVKDKPVGTRLIPSGDQYGKVKIKRFGEIPVIKP